MSGSGSTARGRLAAIDFGTIRIGVAISDPERTLASPLCTYTRRGTSEDADFFGRLVKENAIVQFVVGLPVHLDGYESNSSIEARKFGQWLAELTGVPAVYFDERFTSVEADEVLAAAKMTSKRRKARRDMIAAQILLTAYLESPSSADRNPEALDDK